MASGCFRDATAPSRPALISSTTPFTSAVFHTSRRPRPLYEPARRGGGRGRNLAAHAVPPYGSCEGGWHGLPDAARRGLSRRGCNPVRRGAVLSSGLEPASRSRTISRRADAICPRDRRAPRARRRGGVQVRAMLCAWCDRHRLAEIDTRLV